MRFSVPGRFMESATHLPAAEAVVAGPSLGWPRVRPCSRALRPRVVRRIGVHARAPMVDGFEPQLVVPRLVAVDLAEPVGSAVLGEPRCGIGAPDVDRLS